MKVNNIEVSLYLVAHAVAFLSKEHSGYTISSVLSNHTQDQIDHAFALAVLLYKNGYTTFESVLGLGFLQNVDLTINDTEGK